MKLKRRNRKRNINSESVTFKRITKTQSISTQTNYEKKWERSQKLPLSEPLPMLEVSKAL